MDYSKLSKEELIALLENRDAELYQTRKETVINILEKGSTKISEYLGILKKYNLCCELKSGKTHYFKGNLEELNKYDEVQNIEY